MGKNYHFIRNAQSIDGLVHFLLTVGLTRRIKNQTCQMIQIFQIIDTDEKNDKTTPNAQFQSSWPYVGITFETINYGSFKSMAFPMEFNALQFILFCFVDELVLWLESHSVCVCVCAKIKVKMKLKLNWTRTNCRAHHDVHGEVQPLAHSMASMQKVEAMNENVASSFIQPKIKCRLCCAFCFALVFSLLWSNCLRRAAKRYVAFFAIVNLWYLRRKKAECAPALHRLMHSLFFTFILKSLIYQKPNNKRLNFRWDH